MPKPPSPHKQQMLEGLCSVIGEAPEYDLNSVVEATRHRRSLNEGLQSMGIEWESRLQGLWVEFHNVGINQCRPLLDLAAVVLEDAGVKDDAARIALENSITIGRPFARLATESFGHGLDESVLDIRVSSPNNWLTIVGAQPTLRFKKDKIRELRTGYGSEDGCSALAYSVLIGNRPTSLFEVYWKHFARLYASGIPLKHMGY